MTEHEAKRIANARKPRHEAPAWHRDSAEFGISLGHEGMDGISAENFAHDMIDLCDQYDALAARLSAAVQERDEWRKLCDERGLPYDPDMDAYDVGETVGEP